MGSLLISAEKHVSETMYKLIRTSFPKKIMITIYIDLILTSYTFTDSPPTLPFSEK